MVLNPESFQYLPEYRDDPDAVPLSPLRGASLASSQGRHSGLDGVARGSKDPNVIILPRFEGTTGPTPFAWKESQSPISPQPNPSEVNVPESDDQFWLGFSVPVNSIDESIGYAPLWKLND